MDDELYCAFPAPYLKNPELLIHAAGDAEHRVFYRAGSDSSNGVSIDFFAAGNFVLHEIPWSANIKDFDWKGLEESFKSLDTRCGPLAGYFSYEAGFAFEPEKWQQLRYPTRGFAWRFFQLQCWYEANHLSQTGRIFVMHGADDAATDYLTLIVGQVSKKASTHSKSKYRMASLSDVAGYGELSEIDYHIQVQRVLEDIRAGRYYELNLTQRFHVQSSENPADVFIKLFNDLAPRRGFFCDFQDEVIVSVSPELFLKKVGERISSRPIKGSISGHLAVLNSEKLSAEHIMVVDLVRNDLGRVSDQNYVVVEELQVPAGFGSLIHLESLVSGSTSLIWQRIFSRLCPAASITGMPKVIVVESIAEYENSCRGVYTGVCGWVYPSGDFDFNVGIRTLTATADGKNWHYEFGAGGAIVADSTPDDEYLECLRKAQPLVSALKPE